MLLALIRTMRPRQWTKNVFILAPLVFDGQLLSLTALIPTVSAFILFCFLSSAVYIFNDLVDVDADRNHPQKKNRPIASGILPVRVAIIALIILFILTVGLGVFISINFSIVEIVYFLLNVAYSKWLKHIPLVDVFTIAAGFVLRVVAGVVSISVKQFSPWLYVLMTLLALYLGFGKRRAELGLLANDGNSFRKVLEGYTIPLLDQLIVIVTSGTLVSYSLYTFLAPIPEGSHYLMLTIPFVLYSLFRYLYLVQVRHIGSAPEDVLLSDRPLQIAIVLWGLSIFFIYYILPS
jgi:4-hydroxybenzoate polyprenyltransferase